jgi:hypothetical protein
MGVITHWEDGTRYTMAESILACHERLQLIFNPHSIRRIDVLVCFESLVFIARMIWRVQSLQRRAQVCFQFSRLQVQCHRFGKREGKVKDCQGERHMPAAQLAFIHRAIAAISSVEWGGGAVGPRIGLMPTTATCVLDLILVVAATDDPWLREQSRSAYMLRLYAAALRGTKMTSAVHAADLSKETRREF